MEQPSQPAKKRRLMPKEPPAAHNPVPAPFLSDAPSAFPVQEPPHAERHDFESFARHLQDAAMLIQRQTERSPYSSVSVLLLRWEDDTSVEADVATLENILRDRYHYQTERWNIPTVANPSIKLGVQMASFLEHARPNHLLIIYYAGYGYVSSDNQLYWACNAREDAAKLKWDGVRCLFEDAQSDILLLLDTCCLRDVPLSGSHGVKQAIAACTSEHDPRDAAARSFTTTLVEALHKLGTGRPFSVQRLYDEMLLLKHQEITQAAKLPNGTGKPPPVTVQGGPVYFNLTPGKGQSLIIAPASPPRQPPLQSPHNGAAPDAQVKGTKEEQIIDPESVADLRFDEARVLVCTTFVGDASPDMSSFNGWLQNTPPLGQRITVEGMFLGPPTMLLISMPHSVWNVVQHDKVCCFLGYISSHNMIHLYQKLVGSAGGAKDGTRETSNGRAVDGREAATNAPSTHRRSLDSRDFTFQEAQTRLDALTAALPRPSTSSGGAASVAEPKNEVEDSAEMQEAAEQLKALSHVRHLSDDASPVVERQRTMLPDGAVHRNENGVSHDANDSGADENLHIEMTTPNSRPQARRSLQKALPKQSCSMCSHEPFKDSSSLRKHIAAAHTRPFPCAFSFAGCNSTFGSKNEWKRHIASQHLCFTYYRCSACPHSTIEGKGNEFNRKDLFTQHLRRMHAPFAIKKTLAKADSKIQSEWDGHVKDMQQTCLITRRRPPQRAACPKTDCSSTFEGPSSWDEWTEHVGRHMEKGEGTDLGVDGLLAKWALEEGIIERRDDGEYRLCAGNGAVNVGGEQMRDSITASFPEDLRADDTAESGGDTGDSADAKMDVDG
ncbi:hypothetical protein F5X68DRAFT_68887 [Plectosphaerella plurivora]|uniref:C2H2-type domain-containing protein n=1 Tax=Plectosphaerella plurivora TaxID=936078 RepID=A0A9P9AA78_9PEZI|nr:hypothetical protein F5X68DRAFT_68887 [Plectosphaerella plurivora]